MWSGNPPPFHSLGGQIFYKAVVVRQELVERLEPVGRPPGSWRPWRPGHNPWSARALLLTVLGEFVQPDGERAWTSALIEAMAVLGVEPKTARQAIARTAAAGLLGSERSGRQVRWVLTPAGTGLLTEGAARIYQFGTQQEEWDGRWLVVLASVPEANRRLRYRLRVGLEWHGFAALSPGLWICPWVEREAAAVAVLGDLGLAGEALSFRAVPGALGALEERVAAFWDLDEVAASYQAFIQATEAKAPATPADTFVALATLVHDWRHFPAADPALPERLLPQGWPGRAAAGLFRERHSRWHASAWEWWRGRDPVPPG
jgi:phenylacetic acid degradation operon negative regulatory protein